VRDGPRFLRSLVACYLEPEEGPMPLATLVVYLVIVGVLLWLVNNYIPMDGKIKQLLNAVVVVVVVVWLLRVFGVMGPLSHVRVG
jgi:hypothetical protein